MKVAFQGQSGSYSEAAAASMFATDDLHTIASPSQSGTINKIVSGEVDFGVVRFIENNNSIDFRVVELIREAGCFIARDCTFHEHYNLAGQDGATLAKLKRIYAHPTIIHFCRKFLMEQNDVEIVARFDSAKSLAAMISRGDSSEATIVGDFAIARYGLSVLKSGVEDTVRVKSRFIAVAKNQTEQQGSPTKTAVIIGLKHKVGALFEALAVFSKRDINLTGISTRRESESQFSVLVEFEGHSAEKEVADAIAELKSHTAFLQVLGSFDSMEPRIP